MDILLSPIILALAFGIIYGVLPLLIHALYETHKRVVTCPQTGGLAEIRLEACGRSPGNWPLTSVSNCSLWSEVKGCGSECIKPDRWRSKRQRGIICEKKPKGGGIPS